MSPYILLRDQAYTKSVDDLAAALETTSLAKRKGPTKAGNDTLTGFLSYIDDLLEQHSSSNTGLLSPSTSHNPRSPGFEGPTNVKEAIDLAILRSSTDTNSTHSAIRFEIARSGRRVAVIMLARSAYRLGESVATILDFEGAAIPSYSVHVSLETTEKVDPAISLRSAASITRATRRVYSCHTESTFFARRVVFSPTIPASATPEFITSGVSLDWKIRVEFVTPRLTITDDNDSESNPHDDLLEEIASDDRGVVLAAVEGLKCESFEVSVPIRVFGAFSEGEAKHSGPLVV